LSDKVLADQVPFEGRCRECVEGVHGECHQSPPTVVLTLSRTLSAESSTTTIAPCPSYSSLTAKLTSPVAPIGLGVATRRVSDCFQFFRMSTRRLGSLEVTLTTQRSRRHSTAAILAVRATGPRSTSRSGTTHS